MDKELGQRRPLRASHGWTEPTPTSSRRGTGDPRRDQDREPAAPPSRRPAPVRRRELTPEELAQIEERSRAGLLITAEEHDNHRRHGRNRHGILAHVDPRRG